MSVAEAWGKDN